MKIQRTRARAFAALVFAAGVLSGAGCTREPTDRTSQEAKQAMLSSLVTRFRTAVEPTSFRQAIWNDDCFGIVLERDCTPGTYFGYRLEALIDGQPYAYHALVEDPFSVMLAEGPDPRLGQPALSWQWLSETTGCQSLVIAPDGLAGLGLCGGPHAAHPLLEEYERPQEWQYFHGRFAPFETAGIDYSLTFQGPGTVGATLAWQRAIASWAALQWTEIQTGGSNGSFATGLAVTRPVSGQPGSCDHLEVTEYGRAWLTRAPCDGSSDGSTTDAWLDDDVWDQIGGWYSSWSSLYDTQLGIEFYTEGAEPVSENDKQRLLAVVDQVISRMAPGLPAPGMP